MTKTTKTAKHTPGPWEIHAGYIYGGATDNLGEQRIVATIGRSHDEHSANARLIAAAPELLDGLKLLKDIIEANGLTPSVADDCFDGWSKAIDAIRKAAGL